MAEHQVLVDTRQSNSFHSVSRLLSTLNILMLHERKAGWKKTSFYIPSPPRSRMENEWDFLSVPLKHYSWQAWLCYDCQPLAITRLVILIVCSLSLSCLVKKTALQVKSSFLKLFLTQKKSPELVTGISSSLMKSLILPPKHSAWFKSKPASDHVFFRLQKTVDISPIWIFDLWFRNSVGVLLRGRYCIKWKKSFHLKRQSRRKRRYPINCLYVRTYVHAYICRTSSHTEKNHLQKKVNYVLPYRQWKTIWDWKMYQVVEWRWINIA